MHYAYKARLFALGIAASISACDDNAGDAAHGDASVGDAARGDGAISADASQCTLSCAEGYACIEGTCAIDCPGSANGYCVARPNASASCTSMACDYACDDAHLDCAADGDFNDGCEADAWSRATCGSCDHACNQDQYCFDGVCTPRVTCVDRASCGQIHITSDTDGVLLPRNPAFGNIGASFTIEAWVLPDEPNILGKQNIFVRRGDWGDYRIGFYYEDMPRFFASIDADDATQAHRIELVQPTDARIGQWHHVAVVVAPAYVRLFVDGAVVASAPPAAPITWRADDPRAVSHDEYSVFIGYYASPDVGSSERWIGEMDEVRVSSAALYENAFSPAAHLASTESTVGLWTFDETSGDAASDASASSLNGTLVGATRVGGLR